MKPIQKDDKLTTILALEADGKTRLGECLTAEEMALLLESRLPDVTKDRCLGHISRCDICYGEWKLLKTTLVSGQRKNIVPLFTARAYKYMGATLGVAATIAVFLNIYQPPIPEMAQEDKDASSVVEGQLLSEPETVMDSFDIEESDSTSIEQIVKEEVGPPNASKYMQKSITRGKAEPIDKEAQAPAPMMEENVLKAEPASVKRSRQILSVGKERPRKRQDLSSMVQNGCGQKEYNQDHWITVGNMAENLMQSGRFGVYTKEDIVRVTELIRVMDTVNWQQQCQEILSLLAEDEKSR